MAIKDNNSKSKENKDAPHEVFRHIRTNAETGETDFFYPLEITDPSIRVLARERGLEVGRSRLGFRTFDAVMIPCKRTATVHGLEVFVDTPSDIQRRRYLSFIKDELNHQEHFKQDGRCMVRGENGGLRRCLCRIPNPDFVPGSDQPKTVAVHCEGCKFEPFKQAHTVVEISCLDSENDDGVQAVESVASETGHRFCDDEVYLPTVFDTIRFCPIPFDFASEGGSNWKLLPSSPQNNSAASLLSQRRRSCL